jgi:hypothetical protein
MRVNHSVANLKVIGADIPSHAGNDISDFGINSRAGSLTKPSATKISWDQLLANFIYLRKL